MLFSMKKSVIIIVCCLLFSCATIEKNAEPPNLALSYIEKVKQDPVGETVDWLIFLSEFGEMAF